MDASTTAGGLRVMVVEDDALLGALIREAVAAMGHVVCATERTGPGAVAAASRTRPDVILIDVRLGDGDGRDAMAAVERARPTPHVYLSGAAVEAADVAPGAVILRKPFTEALLARSIAQAMQASRAT